MKQPTPLEKLGLNFSNGFYSLDENEKSIIYAFSKGYFARHLINEDFDFYGKLSLMHCVFFKMLSLDF